MHLLNNRLGRLTALIALGGAALYSQGTQTANITGTVVDAAGAPVAGVTVRLTSPALQGVRTYVTDATGKFIARLLPPGLYTIQYTKDGLETRKITEQIGIDQTFSPKVTLSKAGGAVVEVIAAAPAVDKTDVKTASNYRNDTVDLLPNARTMEGVALLTPGVTAGVGGRVQIRGAMTSGNLYLLDGQNIADNAYNNRGVRTIDDSIEETQVITGAMSAEYGDVDGGVINSITRSGGNEFSGSLRWELSNAAWNATAPTQDRTKINNVLNEEKTLFLSGPILKDRLWFAASFFKTDQATAGAITRNQKDVYGLWPAGTNLNGPEGLNAGYTATSKEIRRQAKLTWSVNQDHTVIASFMNSSTDQINRNYSAAELRSLVPQINTSEFWKLSWRAAWATNFTTELNIGNKKQNLSAGGSPNGESPFYTYGIGGYSNNGIFNSADGGDERDNRTYNVKASLFWDAAGSHQTDFGIDYYEGKRQAKNEQTPTGYIFGVYGLNLATRQAFGADVWTYQSGSGSAKNYSYGLYVNDKWSLNQHWNFQLGLRFDKYKAKNEGGTETAGADGLSPRLGLKYDLFGDSKHIFGLSYARYNAKVLEGITNSVTSQGNPTEIDYAYIGPWQPMSLTALQDLSLYDIGGTPTYYNDPKLNVRLSNDLKAPTVDEVQGSYAYSFNYGPMGDGYVKVTGVYKKWKNLIDYSVGNMGTVSDPTGTPIYIRVWDNNPDAQRKYKGLELEGSYNRNEWSFLGNITWSELKGNYEGESTNSPGRGEGLNNFNVQDGVALYDRNWTTPEGYLTGHVPIRMRVTGNRTYLNSFGKTSIGLVYRFDAGSHYSDTRNITPRALGGTSTIADPNYDPTRALSDTNNPYLTNLSSQFGTAATQYMNQQRGTGVYNAASYLDLAITHDFPLFKVAGKDVTAFGKVVIGNVFNHQQLVTFDTSYNSAPQAVAGGSVNSPWIRTSAFGKPTSYLSYGTARTITASAGFRF
ncbi:TonB-dependent receptor [Geothrix alkalitolerans]|uniref:TonB-dependent receptor n=1 Tax=Geothrix alkalitolerans TaxID=2922724 RepID=UPI001FB023CD|nr:TonB-dependent receptor [Geothrix alkalitolerans]